MSSEWGYRISDTGWGVGCCFRLQKSTLFRRIDAESDLSWAWSHFGTWDIWCLCSLFWDVRIASSWLFKEPWEQPRVQSEQHKRFHLATSFETCTDALSQLSELCTVNNLSGKSFKFPEKGSKLILSSASMPCLKNYPASLQFLENSAHFFIVFLFLTSASRNWNP